MERFEHILIFKTNIRSEADRDLLSACFDNHQHIEEWTVDLDDEDRVLRVVSRTLNCKNIIELLMLHGYECSELI